MSRESCSRSQALGPCGRWAPPRQTGPRPAAMGTPPSRSFGDGCAVAGDRVGDVRKLVSGDAAESRSFQASSTDRAPIQEPYRNAHPDTDVAGLECGGTRRIRSRQFANGVANESDENSPALATISRHGVARPVSSSLLRKHISPSDNTGRRALLTLSRWRHGFESRTGCQEPQVRGTPRSASTAVSPRLPMACQSRLENAVKGSCASEATPGSCGSTSAAAYGAYRRALAVPLPTGDRGASAAATTVDGAVMACSKSPA